MAEWNSFAALSYFS